MHYIICEDEGSGKQFFEYVKNIYSHVSCEIIPANGNQNFSNKLSEVSIRLRKEDSLLLAFDNIGVVRNFNPKEILVKATKICKKLDVFLWYTKYYCFEEVYLSYSELYRLCEYSLVNCKNLKQYLPVLDFVRNSIMLQKDYYDKTNPLIIDFINRIKRAGENREHFCDALLENTSRLLKGDVTICKSTLGKCWICSCDEINFKNKDFVCKNQCNFCMSNNKAIDKLLHLEDNSLSSLYEPFSAFFN